MPKFHILRKYFLAGCRRINKKLVYSENEHIRDIETYLSGALIDNGADFPIGIGNAFTTKYDFSPYDKYLKKLFELIALNVYSDNDVETILKNITPSSILRHKLKSTYGKKH